MAYNGNTQVKYKYLKTVVLDSMKKVAFKNIHIEKRLNQLCMLKRMIKWLNIQINRCNLGWFVCPPHFLFGCGWGVLQRSGGHTIWPSMNPTHTRSQLFTCSKIVHRLQISSTCFQDWTEKQRSDFQADLLSKRIIISSGYKVQIKSLPCSQISKNYLSSLQGGGDGF